jgi:Galactose oxidase, central domain/Kelch motif
MHTIAGETSAPRRAGRGRGRGWGRAFIIVLLLVTMARSVSGVAATHGAARGAHTWSLTGSLITGRAHHTATLLSNGQVLVAGGGFGGDQGETPYASAELYVPRVHRWIATGSMHTRRVGHTATLLHTGQVLVTGGSSGWIIDPRQLSAELYDPRTGRWTVTGRMHTVRMSHTATLLASGKVLVVGGMDLRRHPLASGELYDPHTGAWTVITAMHAARSGHTATLLPSGKVLVAGGEGGHGDLLASAEVYDPHTGTWTVTGSMHTARGAHTATLLPNGTVLVAGGVPAPAHFQRRSVRPAHRQVDGYRSHARRPIRAHGHVAPRRHGPCGRCLLRLS